MHSIPALKRAVLALSLIVLGGTHRVIAQAAGAARPVAAGIGEIRGRLADSASGRAVTGGSVTMRRAGDLTFASGALPKEDGSFRVDGLAPGRYTLRVRAIGFPPVVCNDIIVSKKKPILDV